MWDFDGSEFPRTMRFSCLDVKRPIASASKLIECGGEIVLKKEGSYLKTLDGRYVPVERKGDVFTFWGKLLPNRPTCQSLHKPASASNSLRAQQPN